MTNKSKFSKTRQKWNTNVIIMTWYRHFLKKNSQTVITNIQFDMLRHQTIPVTSMFDKNNSLCLRRLYIMIYIVYRTYNMLIKTIGRCYIKFEKIKVKDNLTFE